MGRMESALHGTLPAYDIVIPCHNRAHVVADALNSVLTQSPAPQRVILVDDGSTDGGAAAVRSLAALHPNVQALALPRNSGASNARNAGTAACGAEWVAFLDSDDCWLPGAAAALLARAAAGDVDVVVGHFSRVVDGEVWPDVECGWDGGCIREGLRSGGVVGPSWSLVRREIVYRAGGFDPTFRNCNDWDFFVRAAATGARFARIDALVAHYRTVAGDRLVADLAALEANAVRVRAHPWLADADLLAA
jgi:glycosyltransferase involved in cell wall biosynthesis